MGQQKKLDRAMEEGVIATCKVWEEALKNTKGIGPILQNRILENVTEVIRNIQKSSR